MDAPLALLAVRFIVSLSFHDHLAQETEANARSVGSQAHCPEGEQEGARGQLPPRREALHKNGTATTDGNLLGARLAEELPLRILTAAPEGRVVN